MEIRETGSEKWVIANQHSMYSRPGGEQNLSIES